MAVYERTYRGFRGSFGPAWSRFLVLPRYSLGGLFSSRIFLILYVLCFVPPLVFSILIYLRHNVDFLAATGLPATELLQIDAGFFSLPVLFVQLIFAFAVSWIVGPALISPDQRNNGLALYFSRPLSRTEYIAGKLTTLAILLSAITWIPGLILFMLQVFLEGWSWAWENLWVAGAIFACSWVFILFFSLVALALSAWVKWKPLAALLYLGLFFGFDAMGVVVGGILRTPWGDVFRTSVLQSMIRASLFGSPNPSELPLAVAWVVIFAICALALLVLYRRLKPYEVVS